MSQKLARELAVKIQEYCDKRGQSLTSLSKESQVPYGTVKRIAQGEREPEFYNTLKLLMVLSPDGGECFDFLSRHYGDVGAFLSRVNYRPGHSSLSEALTDKISFYIIHLAAAKGVTRQEICEEYGRHGLEQVEKLLNKGLIREVNSRLVADNFSFPNAEVALKQMRFLVEDFDATQLGNKKSLLSLQILGLNDAGVSKIYEGLRSLLDSVGEMKDAQEYRGDQVIYLANMFNALRGQK